MGRKLVEAAEHFFDKVDNVVVKRTGNTVSFTTTLGDLQDAIGRDSYGRAIMAVMDAHRPCAGCTELGLFLGPGMREFGVVSTLRLDDGTCVECDGTTSPDEEAALRERIDDGNKSLARAWRR